MGRVDYDAVIVGGGLSGLSLIAHFAMGGCHQKSVLLIDDDTGRAPVRWAFWARESHFLDQVACKGFDALYVNIDGFYQSMELGQYTYRTIRRENLHRYVVEMIKRCPRFVMRRGHVTDISEAGDSAVVTMGGERIRARWVFDSRYGRANHKPVTTLAFSGWWVHCSRPVFNPRVPTFMDFCISRQSRVWFVYIMPETECKALVEVNTFMSSDIAEKPNAMTNVLSSYLKDVIACGDYVVAHAESGSLTLDTNPPPRFSGGKGGRVMAIGARGGMLRASTGYAYERIQRDSAAIAASLARDDDPKGWSPPRRTYIYDLLFLDLLKQDPQEARRVFRNLFERNSLDKVLCFLDGDTSLFDEVRLVATLPYIPFLRVVGLRMVRLINKLMVRTF